MACPVGAREAHETDAHCDLLNGPQQLLCRGVRKRPETRLSPLRLSKHGDLLKIDQKETLWALGTIRLRGPGHPHKGTHPRGLLGGEGVIVGGEALRSMQRGRMSLNSPVPAVPLPAAAVLENKLWHLPEQCIQRRLCENSHHPRPSKYLIYLRYVVSPFETDYRSEQKTRQPRARLEETGDE